MYTGFLSKIFSNSKTAQRGASFTECLLTIGVVIVVLVAAHRTGLGSAQSLEKAAAAMGGGSSTSLGPTNATSGDVNTGDMIPFNGSNGSIGGFQNPNSPPPVTYGPGNNSPTNPLSPIGSSSGSHNQNPISSNNHP